LTLLVEHMEEHVAYRKSSDEVPVWLSVCSEVQMIYILSSWCQCHRIISCFINIQTGVTFPLNIIVHKLHRLQNF